MRHGFATLVTVTIVHITQAALFSNGQLEGCSCATSSPCSKLPGCSASNELACRSPLSCGRGCRGAPCMPLVSNSNGCIDGSCDPLKTLSFDQIEFSDARSRFPPIENILSPLQPLSPLLPPFQTMLPTILSSKQGTPRVRTPYQRVPEIRNKSDDLQQNMAPATVTTLQATPLEVSYEEPIITVQIAEENIGPDSTKREPRIVGDYSFESNTPRDSSTISEISLQRDGSNGALTATHDDPLSTDRNEQQLHGHETWSRHRSDQFERIERTTMKVPTTGHEDIKTFGGISYKKDVDEVQAQSTAPNDYQKKLAVKEYEILREKDEPLSITDNKCNNDVMRAALIDNISDDVSMSKRQIQRVVTEQLGGLIDVICTKSTFSYVVNTELFCESEKNNVTCLVFKQSS